MTAKTIGEMLLQNGVSRRSFMKYCTAMASLMALPPGMGRALAGQLKAARRLPVVYLSFQVHRQIELRAGLVELAALAA